MSVPSEPAAVQPPAPADEVLRLASQAPRHEFFARLFDLLRSRYGIRALCAGLAGPDGAVERAFFDSQAGQDGDRKHLDPAAIVAPIAHDSVPPAFIAAVPADGRRNGIAEYLDAAARAAGVVIAALLAEEAAAVHREEVRMLLATARALSSERDLGRLFARFHELVSTIMDGETFFIALGSRDTNKLEYPYAVELNRPIELASTDIDATVAGHVFTEGKSFLLNTSEDWDKLTMGYALEGLEVISAIFAPMRIGDRTIGVISVQSLASNAYTEQDRDLLVAIAEQAAIAVENSQYLQKAEARAFELKSLADVSRALSTQMSLKDLCRTVCREVRRLIDAPVFFVALRLDNQLVMQYAIEGSVEKDIKPYSFSHSVAERVITANAPVVMQTAADFETQPHRYIYEDYLVVRSLVMTPLRLGHEVIGVMSCQSYRERAYEPAHVDLLTSIAEQLALAVQNYRLFDEAKNRADRDPLTNLFHHRYLKTRLEEELDRAARLGHPLAVLMLDIDHFKLYNDTYGHLAGDEALKLIARVVTRECRTSDIVGRYGGDEFMAILPEADRDRAMAIADRIGEKLAQFHLSVEGERIPIHCSIGVAAYPLDGKIARDVLRRADERLYQGKRLGRLQRVGASQMHLVGDFAPVSELLAALLARDPSTRAHLEHVNRLAADFARLLTLGEAETNSLLLASVLHDVGKIAIPDNILRKPGKLTAEEYALLRRHPEFGALLIEHHPGFSQAAIAVRHHHERYDGTGYPDGLAGEAIPLLARIVSIIDAFSAMTVDRPYHKSLDNEKALAELRRFSGTQFDPRLVERFAALFEGNSI